MSETQLKVSIRVEGELAIIDLQGEINAFAEAALINAYMEASSTEAKSLALDFTDVDYINSTGIALIVSLLAKARKDKQEVLAFGLTDHFQNIFEITRLSDFMQIVRMNQRPGKSLEEDGYGRSQSNEDCPIGDRLGKHHRCSRGDHFLRGERTNECLHQGHQ